NPELLLPVALGSATCAETESHICSEPKSGQPPSERAVLLSWLASDGTVGAVLKAGGFGCSRAEGRIDCSARLLGAKLTYAGSNGAAEGAADAIGPTNPCEPCSSISCLAFLVSNHLVSASCAF